MNHGLFYGEVLKWWRGAPAKGVGRVTGAKVQILSSPPKIRNTHSGVPYFSFCAEKERFAATHVAVRKANGGADNAAQPSRQARLSARQAKLLPWRLTARWA